MAGDYDKKQIDEVLSALGIIGPQLQGVKLGPGVVGRNSSIVWMLEIVMLATAIGSIVRGNALLIAGSMIGAVLVALLGILCNVWFGSKFPAAAVLEGAQFVKYQELMAAKNTPVIEATPPVPPPAKLRESNEPPANAPGPAE